MKKTRGTGRRAGTAKRRAAQLALPLAPLAPPSPARGRGTRAAPDPEAILAGYPREVRALSERLRRLVRAAVPAAAESGHAQGRGIGYRTPGSGAFCGIFPHADCVKLGFTDGRSLPDPDGLLTGTGPRLRYVVLRSRREVRAAALRRLLRAAVGEEPAA